MSHFSISVLFLFGPLPLMAEEAAKTILVVNKGVGGHTSKDGLARFERDVIEVKPDHLILYFGINDACNSGKLVPVERFSRNMQTMIDRSPTRSIILVTPNPVMSDYLALRHPKHPFKADFQSHLDNYDAAIRELASKNKIPIADLRKLMDENGGAAKTRGSLIRNEANRGGKDGVHLTTDGYRLMAGLFEPLLKDRIKAGEIVVCLGDSITFGAHVRGAGTIAGDTYPAWLSVILNRMIGASDLKEPPAPPRPASGVQVFNGEFELCSDRAHADGWNLWRIPGRQQGESKLLRNSPDAQSGKNYLSIANTNEKAPAFLLARRVRLKTRWPYRLTFWLRGTGKVRPLINQVKNRKAIPAFPAAKDNPWRQATVAWTKHTLDYEPSEGITHIGVCFRVIGRVDFDGITLHPIRTPQASSGQPKLKGETLKLSGAHISLEMFPPENGCGIYRLRNSRGYEFITRPNGALWQIELRRLPDPKQKRDPFAPVSFDPEQNDGALPKEEKDAARERLILRSDAVSVQASAKQEAERLVFSWRGINVAEEKSALDVEVTIRLSESDPSARFRTRFANRSKEFTVFYIYSPMVSGSVQNRGFHC